MGEHHTRNTRGVLAYCSTCRRKTMHRVDDRRRGGCTEHGAPQLSKEQERRKSLQEKTEIEPCFEF